MKSTAEDFENTNLQSQIGSFRNLLLYFSLSGSFLCTNSYNHSSIIPMAIGNTSHTFRRIIDPFPISLVCAFFQKIKLYALLWDLEFSTYTTIVAYLGTIAQPFPIFRTLLAIIPSMKNHLNLIIMNKTKSLIILNHLSY